MTVGLCLCRPGPRRMMMIMMMKSLIVGIIISNINNIDDDYC